MQLQRIFTVLDKPKHPQDALARTRTLIDPNARTSKRRSHVAAAFCWQPLAEARKVIGTADAKKLKNHLLAERKHWLAQALEAEPAPNVNGRVIWTPQLADWITDNLTPDRFDLVVKSVHRSRQLDLSDTDWQLLHHCPVPLLLTASPAIKRRRQVLAAVDLRHLDRKHQALNFKVLDAAATLARVTGGTLHIGCAVEYSQVLRDLDLIEPAKLRDRLREDSRPLLTALKTPYNLADEHCHFPVGKAGRAINQLAKEIKAGIVVMGATDHLGKRLLGLGNTASRIVAKASCDVLLVRN